MGTGPYHPIGGSLGRMGISSPPMRDTAAREWSTREETNNNRRSFDSAYPKYASLRMTFLLPIQTISH